VPLSIRVRGASVPLPAVAGALFAAIGWVLVVVYHAGARYVGSGWLLGGLVLYVIYRKTEQKPLLRRVTIPERALRHETLEPEFGSILVPIFGTPLDDDIVQTAGRLAGETRDDVEEEGAMIEAVWVFEIPLSLPLDAPLPDSQIKRARAALARAKQVGEEYEGVQVATATVRARRTGQAIVNEARRRGVEAIVLAAEEPSKVRGGALFGGVTVPLDNYVGDVTKYVIRKAPCRVILTAPPAGWERRFSRPEEEGGSADGGPDQSGEPERAPQNPARKA
jgi:APA family basic amino acid/polyamine antiporter